MLQKIKHNSIKANNKGMVNKYLYCLWALGVDGISEMGTLSCLVLGQNRSQSQILVLKTVRAFPSCPARPEVPRRFLKLGLSLSHLKQYLHQSSLFLYSISTRPSERHFSNSAPRVPHSSQRLLKKLLLYRVTFCCSLFISNSRSQQIGPSVILAAFNQLYQLCLSLLLSTPMHLKVQPQLVFYRSNVHFPEIGMLCFLFLGRIPSLSCLESPHSFHNTQGKCDFLTKAFSYPLRQSQSLLSGCFLSTLYQLLLSSHRAVTICL